MMRRAYQAPTIGTYVPNSRAVDLLAEPLDCPLCPGLIHIAGSFGAECHRCGCVVAIPDPVVPSAYAPPAILATFVASADRFSGIFRRDLGVELLVEALVAVQELRR